VSDATFRAFVGLALPAAIRHTLGEIQSRFRRTGLRANWVRPENFHLTLQFLGQISHAQFEALDLALQDQLRQCSPVHLALDSTGVFPDTRHPAVAWSGIRVLAGDFGVVHGAVTKAWSSAGGRLDSRPPHPHVTLFRMRHCNQHALLRKALEDTKLPPPDDFWADSVALWKSELRRSGAVYDRLKEYPLR
jgi:RNA 2',3'-cyclic 3'-phosphodiesterase